MDVGTLEELRDRWLGPPVFAVEVGRPLASSVTLPPQAEVVRVEETRLVYRTPQWQVVNPQVVQALVAQGYPVRRVEEIPRSLERIYLAVMRAEAEREKSHEPLAV